MAIIQCKQNVRVDRITAGLAWIIFCLEEYARMAPPVELPEIIVITAIADGKHSENSRHYRGEALDIRSKNFPTNVSKDLFRNKFEDYLNSHPMLDIYDENRRNKFRVLLESRGTDNEHFHAQIAKGKVFP